MATDYQQKYKEALERAKKMMESKRKVVVEKQALETIFPELAESEDERIRKALVWHLKADVDFVSNGVTKAECIAYLEKQKERKHTELTAEERMKNDKHFLSICQHLETLISESKNDEAKESIDKDYRWLCEFYRKSLSAPVAERAEGQYY